MLTRRSLEVCVNVWGNTEGKRERRGSAISTARKRPSATNSASGVSIMISTRWFECENSWETCVSPNVSITFVLRQIGGLKRQRHMLCGFGAASKLPCLNHLRPLPVVITRRIGGERGRVGRIDEGCLRCAMNTTHVVQHAVHMSRHIELTFSLVSPQPWEQARDKVCTNEGVSNGHLARLLVGE